MMGLGSIVGTGVFVSLALAAGIAGPAVVLALVLAAGLAVCNALSSAQLAAHHPVSGGTYEYGYRYLSPWLGFAAGWMFLCAKTASAATAALGFAGYFLRTTDGPPAILTAVAFTAVVVLTLVVLAGIRQSNRVNVAVVAVTLASLALFVIAGLPTAFRAGGERYRPFFDGDSSGSGVGAGALIAHLLHATALMFVAYTGYGRIATLGEEVHDPRRTIPRAIVATLVVSAALYVAVALVAVGALGAEELGRAAEGTAAPLEAAAGAFDRWPAAARRVVALGAMTAMLGVLLNLLLGLSRVVLAMGRRGDMPPIAARLNAARSTPYVAVLLVGGAIAALTLVGSVKTTWSFSAFTVLVYYAITNLAALRLKPDERFFHPAFAWCGLAGCLFLAFWVERSVWLAGLTLIAIGAAWRLLMMRWSQRGARP